MSLRSLVLLAAFALSALARAADPATLSRLRSQADLDAVIAAAGEPAKKSALQANGPAILAAAAKKPHVDAVAAVLEAAGGSIEKINTAPDSLKPVLGADAGFFDSLKMVNLASSTLGIKGKREVDPFDRAFYEHLGHITDLESLTILNTTAQNEDLVHIAKLRNLKSLNIINQSKLDDAGLAHLAGLSRLERLGYIGTSMMGHPFKDFNGWTQLKSASFRGSKLDDEGLKNICDKFPQIESLVLAHADFTDEAARNLARLKGLKNFEIGTHKATIECLKNLAGLPIEYLQLGEQLGAPACIPIIKEIKTLKRLTITDARPYTDADIASLATLRQLDHLELGSYDLTDAQIAALKPLAFLKTASLVRRPEPFPPEIRAKVAVVLPKTAVKWE